ncbi:MAG TPA: exonuclease SbcD [Sutterella sp.]|nr:exonuclease SbcD [Sutterella sp.]
MRFLHTSDWHLGKDLGSVDRSETFARFLNWLLETIQSEHIDTLIVAGDVFDTATPPHAAQNLYYSFLGRLSETCCRHAVIVAGNHDSASLIDAPEKLLAHMGIHVCGVPGENELVQLYSPAGALEAVVLAVPYLRERDVLRLGDQVSDERDALLAQSIGAHYAALLERAVALMGEHRVPLLATGHLFAAGGTLGSSERSLYIGNLGQIPANAFPEQIDYLALGHLHRPQTVAGNETRAYSGSPVPLDFSETSQDKQVRIVDLAPGATPEVRTLCVPAFDRLETVAGTAEEILSRLAELKSADASAIVEVIHTGNAPAGNLAEKVAKILAGSRLRLARSRDESQRQAYLAAEGQTDIDVGELTPRDVFVKRLEKAGCDESTRAELQTRFESVLASLNIDLPPGEGSN